MNNILYRYKQIIKNILKKCFFGLKSVLLKNFKIVFFIYDFHEPDIENRLKFIFENKLIVIKINYKFHWAFFFKLFPAIKVYFIQEPEIGKRFRSREDYFNISPFSNHLDAWVYHRILSRYFDFDCAISYMRFKKIIDLKKLENKNLSYIFGTGSSLEKAREINFSNGYVIVCNTIVKDGELWNYLNPDFIVAGDALYHFSDSLFARKFREDLLLRMNETKSTYFIYPSIFDKFVKSELGSISDRCIGIPIGNHKDIFVNLYTEFFLPSKGNILNLILFPLACTLSKTIGLWGFDGRNNEVDKDFWKNSDKHFYNDLVEDLKTKHPAFFQFFIPPGDEKRYVNSVHGDELEADLSAAESKGFNIKMLHPSFTSALNKRYLKWN
jgi:hypothetical protein